MDENKSQDLDVKEIKSEGLHWRVPQRTDRGYLLRTKRALDLRAKFKSMGQEAKDQGVQDLTSDQIDAMAEFLAVYVIEPEGTQQIQVDAILNASEAEIEQMMRWTLPELFTEDDEDQEDPAEQDPTIAQEI